MPTVQLTANPFCILGVSIRSTRDEIVAAYEDALIDAHHYDESTLRTARDVLLAPKARLEAELSWLPDLTPAHTDEVLRSLKEANSPPQGERLLDGVAGVSRANLSAEFCTRFPGNTVFISNLIDAWSRISREGVTNTIAGQRRISGFPKPDSAMVKEALTRLEESHAEKAQKAVEAAAHPGRLMTDVIRPYAVQAVPHSFVSALIAQYDRWSEPKLREIGDRIAVEIARLRGDPKAADSARKISDLLPQWDEFSQPAQLIEQARKLDEIRTKQLVDDLRGLCLWLANEQQQYDSALSISEAALRSFSELPYVTRQLSEDIGTLRKLAAEANELAILAPLRGVAEKAKAVLDHLNADINRYGFSSHARGLAKSLYEAFDAAAKATQSTASAPAPWLIVRDIAIALHNEGQLSDAAYAITKALLDHPVAKPSEVKVQLEKDERQLRRQMRMAEMNRAAERGDVSAGIRLADEILSLTDDAHERRSISSIKEALERRRNAGRLKLLFWGGLALAGVIWFIVENQGTKRPNYSSLPTPSYSPPSPPYIPPIPLPPSTTAEQWPPVGSNRPALPPEVSLDEILGSATGPSSARTATATVTADGLNLRAGPGTTYDIVATLPRGTRLQTLGPPDADGWVKVRTADGKNGYVASKFLSHDQSSLPLAPTQNPQSAATAAPATCVEAVGVRNGTILQQQGKGPHTLRINNGTDSDAVVKVKTSTGRAVLAFFIKANAEAEAQTIPDGAYRILFATGHRWSKDCGRFLDNMQAMEFEGSKIFKTRVEGQYEYYNILTYTLHTVAGGTAHATRIPAESF